MDVQRLQCLCRRCGFSDVAALHDRLHQIATQVVKCNSLRWLYCERDLTQDIWLKLLQDNQRLLALVAETRNPDAYLRRMMANRLHDVARCLSRVKQMTEELSAVNHAGITTSWSRRHNSASPMLSAVRAHVAEECDALDRAVFRSLVVQGQTAVQLAAEVGVEENALYVRKHRLLKRLRLVASKARNEQ